MTFAWLLLILAVTVGNLALGFGLACLFGHGPKLADLELPEIESLLAKAQEMPSRLADLIRPQK